jgi:hypothetical protein
MNSQTAFCFGVIVGAAIMYFAARWQMSGQKRGDRAKHKLASQQYNIGNRIYRAVDNAAAQNSSVRLQVSNIARNGDLGYSVLVKRFGEGIICQININLSPYQIEHQIDVHFPENNLVEHYDVIERHIRILIQEVQFFVANYSLERRMGWDDGNIA